MTPWVPCDCCPEFFCTIHGQHVYECPCKPTDEWDTDQYQPIEAQFKRFSDFLRRFVSISPYYVNPWLPDPVSRTPPMYEDDTYSQWFLNGRPFWGDR